MESKLAFLFPGQGSQFVGMGYTLASRFSDFEPIFSETLREAEAHLGFSLSQLLKDGPAEKLKETEITQPALLAVSTAMSRWLKAKGIKPDFVLGHSVGEFAALVHSESLLFKDAVKLVQLRGRLMQTAVPMGEAGMGALLGADQATAEKLCASVQAETKLVLEVSLLNAPGQIVVSGHKKALEVAAAKAREFGIRKVILLEVSGPFHSSLLSSAGEKLGVALKDTPVQAPKIPVISNVSASPEKTPDEIRANLTAQVSKAVRWEESIRYAASQGVGHFIEVGAGNVLTGMVKKILPDAKSQALDAIENLGDLFPSK